MALAPIRDSSLNICLPQKSPHTKTTIGGGAGVARKLYSIGSFVPLTPNQKGVRPSTPKTITFKDQRLTPNSTSNSPSLQTSPERIDKTAAASLAATKLKLKLQLALYKLQKKGTLPTKAPQVFISSSINIDLQRAAISLEQAKSTHNNGGNASTTNTTNFISTNTGMNNTSGVTKRKKPSLTATAYDRNLLLFKNTQKLRLYSIKKDSKFYADRNGAVPLTPNHEIKLPKPINVTTDATTDAAIPTNAQLNANSISNNHLSHSKSRQLPSINKILKTPMKSSSRNLVNPYLPTNNKKWKNNLNTDETIDEDDDGPLKESTCTSIRVGNKELLSSSPIRANSNSFGTPNSFSVAKSLLQLGSGFYS